MTETCDASEPEGRGVDPSPSVTVIEPPKGLRSWRLGELLEYRELFYFLALRDVKVQYKQAAMGVGWAIVRPIVYMVIFSVIFGKAAKLPSEGIPYPIFSFAALLPWQLFAQSIQRSGGSLVINRNLLTRIYCPRLIIPISAMAPGVLDFAISFVVLIGLMVYYGITPTWAIVTLPLFTLLAFMAAVGVSLWLSAMNVLYRDVQYAIPFVVQAWMYISPVAYSTELVDKGPWRWVYGLNPMAGVIQGFRWALVGASPPGELFWLSVVVVVLLLASGLVYFKHTEKIFADVV